jgi:hypothetical protein
MLTPAPVGEAQEIRIPGPRLLSALGANRPSVPFFVGDQGQLPQEPFLPGKRSA